MPDRVSHVGLLLAFLVVQGCTTTSPSSEPVALPAGRSNAIEEPDTECAIVWKGLSDLRDSESLGRRDGQPLLYPYFSSEVDRRIGEALAFYEVRRPRAAVRGELVWARVNETLAAMEMTMTFKVHKEGEAATFATIATRVTRQVITGQDRVGFIGSALQESIEQFKEELQDVCCR